MAAPTSVLDLLLTRRVITIDGQAYPLKNPEELSLFDFRRLQRLGDRLNAIESLEEPSAADETEYAELLDAFVRMTLVAPAAVLEQLASGQRTLVVAAFFGLSRTRPQQTGADEMRAELSPTTKPSRASRASTAARRRTG